VFAFLIALAAQAAAPAAQAGPPQPPPRPDAQPASSHLTDEEAFEECAKLAKSDANKAVDVAGDWLIKGGGISARQCLGLAYVALERWTPAATTFEQASQEAEAAKDARAADLRIQAGNSWLAADDGAKARPDFDAALAAATLPPQLNGEVHIDRARAGVALGDLAGARADLDKAIELVPADPMTWYLSAALWLRQEAVPRAQADIAKALALAPDDAGILLQAGTIAGVAGDLDGARAFYTRAIQAAPGSDIAHAAEQALAADGSDQPSAPAKPPTPVKAPAPSAKKAQPK
jgi:tetratricopeptide (TPR) repeat protein